MNVKADVFQIAYRIGLARNGRNELEMREAIIDYVQDLQRERAQMLQRVQEIGAGKEK